MAAPGEMTTTNPTVAFTLDQDGLSLAEVHPNVPPSALYEHAIPFERDASIAEDNGLIVLFR